MKCAVFFCLCPLLAASVAVSAPAKQVPFTKSRFPGVQVRHVPQKAAATGPSSVKVLPGSPRPQGLRSTATRAEPLVKGRGVTAKGGTWVRVPASRHPLEKAHRLKNGKVVLGCPPHAGANTVRTALPATR